MTQREDALKFEQGRNKALQEERLHIQKKTFTKWMNSFLQMVRMEVEDLSEDLADGRRLLKLLEIISGERLPRPNSGRMRVHKIENVNKSLSFLHTKVRLESIGAEDIVDGNPCLILGLIWTIILRFQIQEIEIDVDEENESSEKKSAKDALLLWCQRKTNGYHGVHIHNFSDSWRSGLGFNALIHAHRPDLFRWTEVPVTDHVETLNHAFEVAHKNLGIPKLLDAEDVDTHRPDEKSVMTYVASYYHTFARMKNEQKSGRRIANIIGQLVDCDARKAEYSRLLTTLLEWIRMKISELNDRELPNSLDGIQRLLLAFKQYRTVEKPPKYKERSEIEALYFHINTMQKALVGEAWTPEGQLPQDLERAWQQLEQAEHAREIALRTELLRQQRLEQLNYKFNTKSVLRKGYLKEMIQVLSDPRYGSNLAQVDATVKKHEAISADILARTERFEDLSAMAAELVKEKYHGAEAVEKTSTAVLERWRELLALLERHRKQLAELARLCALLREADAVQNELQLMRSQFQSEEVGRHLSDVERLLQAHALQELQLGALDETIRRLVRQGNTAEGPQQPKKQLADQLTHLEDAYDSLVAAAKDRKARLEDARNLYQFLEDHDEEEGWVTEKQRICRTDVAAKDLRGVLALRLKHTALLHELRARKGGAQRHRTRGQGLIDAKHPKSAEIERRLSSLNQQWDVLSELADAREKKLADAAEAYQFYGDANEAESWMKEKRPLAGSSDCGGDAPSAAALLARHRALQEEVQAYSAELEALRAHAQRLTDSGITQLQLPTEVEAAPAEEEEWVKETRLVPTDVWEEQPVERLEHRTVTEQRAVPQVKALYAFSGQGISIQKGEVMFLISKSNPDWWSVRKADRSDGFVPANYVREIEPRMLPVQVRRPEKVRTVQRVKKTVLVKQVVPVRKVSTVRRPSRADVTARDAPPVPEKMKHVDDMYNELVTLATARRAQLEDAIKLYSLFAEYDDLDKWIRDKEKLLRSDDAGETVDSAKRKYEKFVTDLSAASKRLEHIDSGTEELIRSGHGQAGAAAARRKQLRARWAALLHLKLEKEKSLEGADSVVLFGRTCDEALDWMLEKEAQLAGGGGGGGDLRDVRALQRRHAQLERELEPLREKVTTVTLLADSVKSQYPNERANVEARQREIEGMWQRCQRQAAERRERLENAVGHQIFNNSCNTLLDWVQQTREQIGQEVPAKDVATAEAIHKQHQEILDDLRTRDDEFGEVIALGEKLYVNNPALTDVADKIKSLKEEHNAVDKEWRAKDEYLRQRVQLAMVTREADQLDAGSRAHEACLDLTDLGSSVDEVEALVKRHEELEARLAAQEDRLAAFMQPPPTNHYAKDIILERQKAVSARRSAVRSSATSRRRALQASLAHHQFLEAADELDTWIQDKTRTAMDQNYRDLTNLERKLQKHEAFERELQANEKQLRNVESVGQSLVQSDAPRAQAVTSRLEALQSAWAKLVAASRDKGSKLRQAHSARAHKRAVDDASARLAEVERALKSEENDTDLRSCKRLINRHQALEQELSSLEQKASALALSGQDLASGGHFDAPAIQACSQQLLGAAQALRPPAAARRQALQTCMQFHKFAAEVSGEMAWLAERRAAAASSTLPTELLAAQSAAKRHAKLRAELEARRPALDRVLQAGRDLAEANDLYADQIKSLSNQLEEEYSEVCRLSTDRASQLEAALRAQQLLHEALELDGWLADTAAALHEPDSGRDRHRATALLARHKAVELELDTYAAIISEMRHVAAAMQAAGNPAGPALVARGGQLAENLGRLQRAAAQRQKDLLESVCRHEYLAESAELEEWIQEQFAAASSEDYGQDYEHLLLLRSKFEELRLRVESGAERFAQCEELAKKLLASNSRYIPDIEKRQEALGESWQRLVEQIQTRAQRLHAAGEIHRFHRDVADLISRAADKRAQLAAYTEGNVPRARDTLDNDLVAIEAQMQVLQEEGQRLQRQYPGDNEQQIARQQRALSAAADALRAAAAARRQHAARRAQTAALLGQIRDLMSWSAAARASMAVEAASGAGGGAGAAAAQALRAEHDALRAEIEAREPGFRAALERGAELVKEGHPDSQEISERCTALAEERARLGAAWAARQVALDQLIDLRCFLRDAAQLHELCGAQEGALGTEISPTLSVEEVQNQLKKHEAFEKLLVTQDERLSTLNNHGDKLLQQNHVESKTIAKELHALNERRKKVHELSQARRSQLQRALARAQFARDVAEARAWVAGKLHNLQADQKNADVSNLEEKIKMLQKHQAFKAELAANEARVSELGALAAQLKGERDVQHALAALRSEWARLVEATDERGRGLEEAQDILEFNQHLDKVEAWLRDKEMMVQAHELGRDYEHCSALLRKLDDLDSDMQVDDKQAKLVTALADKLLQQGPTQQAAAVAQRRDAFVNKWRALAGALQTYRDHLTTALDIHAFHRDVEDTQERISSKAALFASRARGRDLAGAHELRRRHDALASEAGAAAARIRELQAQGARLATDYPERAIEIQSSLKKLQESWDKLQKLQAERSAFLDDAIAEHRFDESLKELELWVGESVKRMNMAAAGATPTRPADLQASLLQHQEIRAEIDGRQKSIAALQKQAETELAGKEDLPEKLEKLSQLAATLNTAWNERKTYLTEAHQMQQLSEQAQQVEDWLAAKEAFLNNDDLGENLDAVETLIRKHAEFSKLLESQSGRVEDLDKFAATLLDAGHSSSDVIRRRLADARNRADKLKESCKARGDVLAQSRQLQQFLRNLDHEREWIALKMQIATDQNYRELSNLQSKIQKHAAFESELAANKGRLDDVARAGESLAAKGHYAARDIGLRLEDMEAQWAELESAAKLRRQRLQEAYQARVYLRGLDDFTSWLDDVESQLCSEDHGKDLPSVSALLKRHARLEQQVSSQADAAVQLADTARHLADAGHFMADEITAAAEDAVKRYSQLQEPIQIRRENLDDAKLLHQWNSDADEEMSWLREREGAVSQQDEGASLAQALALQKKHLAVEAELSAREPTVKALEAQALQLSRRGHFAGAELESRAAALRAAARALADRAAARHRRLANNIAALQLLTEVTEAEAWLLERRASLASPEHGRDEAGALRLQRRLEAELRELEGYDATVTRLEKAAQAIDSENPTPTEEQIKVKAAELRELREDMKLLAAKRERRLQHSLKYFKFVQEAEETQEWVSSQMARAASEDYGVDVEHVDALQQTFDYFLQQLHANEGRIEAVMEAGNALLEENSPESERVRQRMEDTRGLWDDLRELAAARQEALAGARQVHEFDRTADETVSWIQEKQGVLSASADLRARTRHLHALRADLAAIAAREQELEAQKDKLSEAFPDAREHVTCKLDDVREALGALQAAAATAEQQCALANQLQAYFDAHQDLLAWCNETLARVTAAELGADVAGAERVVARHADLRVEIDAKQDEFQQLYSDGEKLVKEGHFMSGEIAERMSTLRARKQLLDETWSKREAIYAQHLDALVFRRDADALDGWIESRVPLVRDGKLGDSVSQVEQLINRHRDLEETILAQRGRVDALRRITLVEQAFQAQKESEAEARRASVERRQREQMEQLRRREVERIAAERRREQEVDSSVPQQAESEETLSPAPQFEKLPKAESAVKRAESMQVVKTPKRTPSFTTRRRTQSFRRHQRPDAALPPVEIEGVLERKQEAGSGGARATVRSWRSYYSVLCGQLLAFFRDRDDWAAARAAAPPAPIHNARCEPAEDYTKRAHVFRLQCADGAEYLFACPSHELMLEWVAKISFHAKLPPELQLTPYGAAEDLKKRLHQNASSSSSETSPEPRRQPRTQADILNEARASRNIESAVLPSLPPRQREAEDVVPEVIMRNSEQNSSSWGRSRFSNGRDINAEFIRSQREAEGAPPLPPSAPPADRAPTLPERNVNIPERVPTIPERTSNVSSLVNSYQRMTRTDNGRSYERESQNNNWQNVETSTHFYATNDMAYGGARPASVAGSGGSPALDRDPRPASRSSGESELSVSGVPKDKKDKKGVFGGLFSRKKRPQSHM